MSIPWSQLVNRLSYRSSGHTSSRTPVPIDGASPAAINMKRGRPYHHLRSESFRKSVHISLECFSRGARLQRALVTHFDEASSKEPLGRRVYDASQDSVDPLGPLDLEYVFRIGKVGDTDLEDLVHVDTAQEEAEGEAEEEEEFLEQRGSVLDVGEHLHIRRPEWAMG